MQVKSDGSSMVGLSLEFSSATNVQTSVLLSSWGNTLLTMNKFSNKFTNVIMPRRVTRLGTAPDWVVQESSIEMNGHILTGIHVVCYRSISEINKLKLESGSIGRDITSPRALSEYYAVLGHMTIRSSSQDLNFPPSIAWLVEGHDIKWNTNLQGSKTLSVKIIWTCKDGNAFVFTNYNIYVKKQAKKTVEKPGRTFEGTTEFLGVAQVEAFYVSDLLVPSGTSSLRFVIQVCGLDGVCQRLDDSPFFQLTVEGS